MKPFPSYDGTRFSPLMVEMLLTIYTFRKPEGMEFQAQLNAMEFFREKGLVVRDGHLTMKGEQIVEQILKEAATLVEAL